MGMVRKMLIHLPFNQLVRLVGLEKFIAFICLQSLSYYTNNCVFCNKSLVHFGQFSESKCLLCPVIFHFQLI